MTFRDLGTRVISGRNRAVSLLVGENVPVVELQTNSHQVGGNLVNRRI
jgi:hypothetical protein